MAKSTFLAACREVWDAVSPALPTLYLDNVPEGTGYPRAIMRHGGEGPTVVGEYQRQGGPTGAPRPTISEAFVSFDLMAENDSDAVEALALVVMQAFVPDSIKLTFDSKARIFRLPRGYLVTLAGTRSKAGKPVYQATIDYKAVFSTTTY